ncbi:hypothetical protein [Nocardia nova]|uniref:hypothetical protein n=1 Tax=Nocardia nova TaxID=37330 RepID=UPI0033E12370
MGLADELGWDDTTPIQRYQQQLRGRDALPAAQAAGAKRSPLLPAAHVGDSYRIRKAHIEYLEAIGDPQWRQRLDDLDRYDFHRYWADYDIAAWGPWREPITPLAQYLNAVKFCDENDRRQTANQLRNHGAPPPEPSDGEQICAAYRQFRELVEREARRPN